MNTPTLSLKKVVDDAKAGPEVKKPASEMAYVRAKTGRFLHLFTNVVFTTDPKKVDLDSFVKAQIAAGKLEIVPA